MTRIKILLFFLLFLFGCTLFTNNYQKDTSAELEGCKKIQDIYDRDACFFELGTAYDNPDACDMISDEDDKGQCLTWVVQGKNNISICDRLNNSYRRADCYAALGRVTGNASLCLEKEGIYRDGCYKDIAVTAKDPKYCMLMSNGSRQEDCLVSVSQLTDSDACELLPEGGRRDRCTSRTVIVTKSASCESVSYGLHRDSCYSGLAKSSKNKAHCDKIVNQNYKSICEGYFSNDSYTTACYSRNNKAELLGNCFTEFARSKKNATLCEYMPASYSRDNCYQEIALLTLNVSYCEFIAHSFSLGARSRIVSSLFQVGAEVGRDFCYKTIGVKTLNEKYCANILDDVESRDCFTPISKAKRDPKICNDLINIEYRDYCYREVGKLIKNITVCEHTWDKNTCLLEISTIQNSTSTCSQITNNSLKVVCYAKIGSNTGNISICNLIGDEKGIYQYDTYSKDLCYRMVARRTLNVSICSEIGDQGQRAICLWGIAYQTKNKSVCEMMGNMVGRIGSSTYDKNSCYRATNS